MIGGSINSESRNNLFLKPMRWSWLYFEGRSLHMLSLIADGVTWRLRRLPPLFLLGDRLICLAGQGIKHVINPLVALKISPAEPLRSLIEIIYVFHVIRNYDRCPFKGLSTKMMTPPPPLMYAIHMLVWVSIKRDEYVSFLKLNLWMWWWKWLWMVM